MKKRLPILIILATIALGGWLLYREYKNRGEEIVPAPISPAAALGSAALVLDSDGDGLKDWEEELWHTDPHNSDTDGDGTSDGTEVKQGRNPLIRGPNDKLDAETIATKVNPDAAKDIPDTERLAKELFATYLSSRKEGVPLSQAEIDTMVNTVSASVPVESPTVYTEAGMQTFADENTEALRAYGNAVGAAFKKPWPSRENELVVFERAVKDPNPETARLDLANLIPIANAYAALGKALAIISTPQSALILHLRIANAAAELGGSVRGMSVALDDPVKAIGGVARYFAAAPRLGDALASLRVLLEGKGIAYTETENGYAIWRATTPQ